MEAGASEPADGIRPIGHDEVSLTLQHEVPLKSVGAARMSAINWPALCGDMEQAAQPWKAHRHSGGRRACHAVARS